MTTDEADVDLALRAVLRDVLGIDENRIAAMSEATPLFGAVPELDSMAVAALLTALEDRLGIIIHDDDIDAETFETFGKLLSFLFTKTII